MICSFIQLAALTLLPISGGGASTGPNSNSLDVSGFESRFWTTEDGLPQNSVSAMVQTRDGYLWIGTFGGLARFDGVHFEVFDICALERGLAVFHEQALTYVTPEGSEQVQLPLEQPVRSILSAPDAAGGLWFMSGAGLHRWAEGELTTHTLKSFGVDPLNVQLIGQSPSSALWLSIDSELGRFHEGDLNLWGQAEGLPRGKVRDVLEDSDGDVWITTYGGGLARLRDDEFRTITRRDGLFDNSLGCVLEGDDGLLWINSNRGCFSVRTRVRQPVAYGAALCRKHLGVARPQPASFRSRGLQSALGHGTTFELLLPLAASPCP